MVQDIMPGTEDQLMKEMTTAYIGFDPTSDSLHIDGAAKPRFDALAQVALRHLTAAESMTAFRNNAE